MPEVFEEDFDDVGDWDFIEGVEVQLGKLVLTPGFAAGSAIRRETTQKNILVARAEIVLDETDGDVKVFLSRNARHYTVAEGTSEFAVSTFKETDGTADFVDIGQVVTPKRYGIRLLLQKAIFEGMASHPMGLTPMGYING